MSKAFKGAYSKPQPEPDETNTSPYKRRLALQEAIAKEVRKALEVKTYDRPNN